MIASQKIGKSFMGALKYNWNKLFNADPKLRAKLLSTNFVSMDMATIKQEVDIVRSFRPALNKYVYHTSLNFSKEDVLDNKTMLAIAEDYLRLSGYTNNQYFIFRHHDADHPHLHLLVNRITFDGDVVSDSNNYKKSEIILRGLEQQYNLVAVEHSNHVSIERHNSIPKYPVNSVTNEQGNYVFKDLYNNVPEYQRDTTTIEQTNYISVEKDSTVSVERYNKTPLRAPTKGELEMVQRTGKASDKMVLQEKLLRLVSKSGISLQEFINKCEAQDIHLLFNQASTGRVSGITYFYGDFKIKGQKLGNRFKWAEIIKNLDYEQGRNGKAISQANERTRGIYGDFTKGMETATGGLEADQRTASPDAAELHKSTQNVETDGRNASEATNGNGDGTAEAAKTSSTGAVVDNGSDRYGDWRDHAGGYIPSIEISDDIDDEAILGRNRRRQKKARTNMR
jgi:hypothetical protein